MSEFETATNPAAGAEAAPAPEVEQEPLEQITEGDGTESEQTTQADDHDEIEHEGQKYRIPKAVKPLVMMQSDYTRKTQALAEQQRNWEQERTQQAEAYKANQKDQARLVAIDDALEQYRKLNWDAIWQQDPSQHGRLSQQFNTLKDNRDRLANDLNQKEQARQAEEQRKRAKQFDDAGAYFVKEIPGWSTELAGKLGEYALANGMTNDQLQQIIVSMPQAVKVLHAAYVGQQLIAKQKAAQSKPAPAPEPVPTVTASRAPAAKDPDRMSTKEWMEHRNKQVAAKNRR